MRLRLSEACNAGGEASEETREHCQVAAFGPWLAESLKCFHQWIDAKLARQLHSKVSLQISFSCMRPSMHLLQRNIRAHPEWLSLRVMLDIAAGFCCR